MASAYGRYASAETNENYNKLWCCWMTQRSAPLNLKQDVASPVEWVVSGVSRLKPGTGVSVDDDEVDGVGDKVGDDKAGGVGGNSVASTRVSSVLTNACSDPRTAVDYCLRFYLYPDRWSAMNRLRTVTSDAAPALSPESTFFIEYCAGGPSSATPVLLSCVASFDTAPPPQDLLAGLLYTAPPPSTGDGSFDSYLSSP
ncbi:uncharacterized protein UHOD_11820 [Ustilago sp. UG-2017b]|nr:uncharacterized protein UHOD_11820 [Ustilago sp. UG-2017b]